MPCFRYPGGKSKIKNKIISIIDDYYGNNHCYDSCQYIEPFFGAGAIGINLILSKPIQNIMILDADPSIASFWQSVIRKPEQLYSMIEQFEPSIEAFYDFKDFLTSEEMKNFDPLNSNDFVEVGFKKLALHQISYSGLGPMSGGPLGGKKQTSTYKINCRWNPDKLIKEIKKVHNIFKDINIYNNSCLRADFSSCIDLGDAKKRFIYLDPPYYEKGGELYQYSFNEEDHKRLMSILKDTEYPWLLSYDSHDEIKKLYSWACVEEIDLTYTINAKNKGRRKTEFLITSHKYSWLLNSLRDNEEL